MIRVDTNVLRDCGEQMKRIHVQLMHLEDRIGDVQKSSGISDSVFEPCRYSLSRAQEQIGGYESLAAEMMTFLFRAASRYEQTERNNRPDAALPAAHAFADHNPYRHLNHRHYGSSPEIQWIDHEQIRAVFADTIRALLAANE